MVDISKQAFKSSISIQLANNAIRFLEGTPIHSLPPQSAFAESGVNIGAD